MVNIKLPAVKLSQNYDDVRIVISNLQANRNQSSNICLSDHTSCKSTVE